MHQMIKLHKNFYSRPDKQAQDAMILKLCSIVPTQHKRDFKGKKQTTMKFSVYVDKTKIPVCKNHFMSIFQITKHRINYVMQRYYYTGQVADERRGGNRKKNKYADQRASVHNFIQKLKCHESHYCRKSKNTERKYLPSDLNISKLFKIYQESEHSHPDVKLSYFRSIFNNSYNIGFGSPRTDVCSTCLELSEKIKNEADPAKKSKFITEKRVHSLRAKAFYEKLREQSDGLKIISFDCQKNLPLPKLPDQACYYSRQLYYYNFTMVEGSSTLPLEKQRIFAYICTENEFSKDSNLVASAVFHRLTATDKNGIHSIRLVADGCSGQNKNCIVVGTCAKWLLDNPTIKTIEIVFPVTGHSYMPADRTFGIIEKKLKKLETILHPKEISDIISETSTIIRFGDDCPVLDWRSSVKSILKVTTSWPLQFKECKRFILRRTKAPGNVLIRGELHFKSNLATPANVCQRGKRISMINPDPLPKIVPVNKNKLKDVKTLLSKHFGDWENLHSLLFYKEC